MSGRHRSYRQRLAGIWCWLFRHPKPNASARLFVSHRCGELVMVRRKVGAR